MQNYLMPVRIKPEGSEGKQGEAGAVAEGEESEGAEADDEVFGAAP